VCLFVWLVCLNLPAGQTCLGMMMFSPLPALPFGFYLWLGNKTNWLGMATLRQKTCWAALAFCTGDTFICWTLWLYQTNRKPLVRAGILARSKLLARLCLSLNWQMLNGNLSGRQDPFWCLLLLFRCDLGAPKIAFALLIKYQFTLAIQLSDAQSFACYWKHLSLYQIFD